MFREKTFFFRIITSINPEVSFYFVFKVFPPALSDLPPPMLDLFDLDETFSSEKVRLAQLTNKCKYFTMLNDQ